MTAARNPKISQKSTPNSFVMVPTSLHRHYSSSQNTNNNNSKTYVRLSMKHAQDHFNYCHGAMQQTPTNKGFTCYQTLMDVNNPKYASATGKNISPILKLGNPNYSQNFKTVRC